MESCKQPTDGSGGDELLDFEEVLGYRFADRGLLVTALTHSSYSAENSDTPTYERLEFLGDAVLELATTQLIYSMMGDATEGEMTKVRASVVDAATVGDVGRLLGLGGLVRLGVGEQRSGGADRDSMLSDVMEAVIGAVLIDAGFERANEVILSLWTDLIVANIGDIGIMDARSKLQESLARTGRVVVFEFERSGPDHAALYTASARVDAVVVGSGTAGSKKMAAIAASQDALDSDCGASVPSRNTSL
jgi:ribonuclease-3